RRRVPPRSHPAPVALTRGRAAWKMSREIIAEKVEVRRGGGYTHPRGRTRRAVREYPPRRRAPNAGVTLMAAIVRFVTPGLGAQNADAGPFAGPVVASAPVRVTAEAYPVAPATRITGQSLSVNGAARAFTSVSGQNPTTLQF